jgi:very-short-patch-repair endonuclease
VDPSRLTKAGARMLAEYLEYAGSGGVPVAASGSAPDSLDPFSASVQSRLAAYGITVVPQYGVGGYRVDFAVAHPGDASRMILAVESDGASYRDSGSVRDRDRLRKEHLERLGWRFHRLWSTNWFHDPDREVAKLREAYEQAVAASPLPDPGPGQHGSEPPETPAPATSGAASRASGGGPAASAGAQPAATAKPQLESAKPELESSGPRQQAAPPESRARYVSGPSGVIATRRPAPPAQTPGTSG